ncbi:MAG: U32 family peptidase, partial [Muribaculaceae bacterium]|nr:U32 family peptidase [Muribaculaceae bacterium]
MSRKIELLSPAANAQTAIEAILHGADAVYIGGPSHGARKNAANSLDEIRRIVDFAHIFRAKVYVTVNTIIYPHELKNVERMIQDLYKIGVDALIVQDMGILRMDIPPIALHASTQCDNRTPEKARFLESVGFSQIVLARELTIPEIRDICESVTIPVETFVHGALCVSYSGRCHASFSCTGRSANRGECAQICRLPYDLTDSSNRLIKKGKHLLSLKDFNASHKVEQLLEAGVSSFKIEGRLKEVDYVKNITAEYNRILNRVIEKHPDLYQRSSIGRSIVSFEPQTDKSFNRGFTTYFLDSRHPQNISQPATPKSMGEIISDIHQLHNGDGISFFDSDGNYSGVMVNGIRGNEIKGNKPFKLPKGSKIHRTFDIEWQKKLSQPSAARHISLNLKLSVNG